MVPRIDAGAIVQLWLVISVAVVPSQRATVIFVGPALDSVYWVQVVGSTAIRDEGALVAVVNCCSSKVGLTMCT